MCNAAGNRLTGAARRAVGVTLFRCVVCNRRGFGVASLSLLGLIAHVAVICQASATHTRVHTEECTHTRTRTTDGYHANTSYLQARKYQARWPSTTCVRPEGAWEAVSLPGDPPACCATV